MARSQWIPEPAVHLAQWWVLKVRRLFREPQEAQLLTCVAGHLTSASLERGMLRMPPLSERRRLPGRVSDELPMRSLSTRRNRQLEARGIYLACLMEMLSWADPFCLVALRFTRFYGPVLR